jgi:hypothetical protein
MTDAAAAVTRSRSASPWPPGSRACRSAHRSLLVAATVTAGLLLAPSVAGGATITVETIDDVSATDCTLRDAIGSANDNAATGACTAGEPSPTVDEIDFSLPGGSTITLGSTLPDIASDMSVSGPGASQLTISGNDAEQVLIVSQGATASISGLSIADGLCDSACGSQGGGVLNEGTLTLDGVNVTDNTASASGGTNAFPEGGGIENNSGATLTITDSSVSDNTASASGATNQNGPRAGGIMNRGTLTLSRSTMNGNAAAADAMGGAFASANGGAITNFAMLTVRRSTVSGNSATGTGGVTANGGDAGAIGNANSPSVDVTIDRSTLSMNVASGNVGGLAVPGGTATVTGSTLSHNSAPVNANATVFANTTFENTIVANPLGGGENCGGGGTSAGHNLEDGSAPGTCGFTRATDLHADPLLDVLADNGGPTVTRALLTGSPAIDAGKSLGANTDQRGEPRPFDFDSIANASGGDGADIGAFEVQGTPVATNVKLTASRKRVPEGKKVKLKVKATPCPGRAGDTVILYRGPMKVDTDHLSSKCKATFKRKIKRKSTFKAKVPADTEHNADTSNKVTVRVKR